MTNVLKLTVFIFCVGPLSASADIRVRDYLGRAVVLEKPARRIVGLAPHIVENAWSAGAGEYLVAAVDYSDYPPAARQLPRVGGFNSFSVEAILALSPDLVISWVSGNGAEVVEQLARLDIPVYADEPGTLPDIARSIRDIGKLAGTSAQSDAVADRFLAGLKALENRYRATPEIGVFYQVWNQPLQTVNGEHIITDVLKVCGARNIFADAAGLAPKINIETVLQRNPDVILASGIGAERPGWLDEWKQFPAMKAVRNKRLFFVPPDYIQRHTVRILEGAKAICGKLAGIR